MATIQKKKKEKKITNIGEDMEKSEYLCTVSGNIKWCSCYGKQYDDSSKD